MKRLLVWWVVIFCLGITAATFIKINFIFTYFLSVTLLVFNLLFFKKSFIFGILSACLVFSLGYLSLKNSLALPNCHISKYAYYNDSKPYLVRGVIDSHPLFKNNKASFVLKAKEIQFDNLNHTCCGDLLVYVKGAKNFVYGEEVLLKGNLRRPGRFRKYLYKQGIYSIFYVDQKSTWISLNKNKGFALKKLALWLKVETEGIIFKYLPRLPAAILDAMILGEGFLTPILRI